MYKYRSRNSPPPIPTKTAGELFAQRNTNVGINFDQYDAIPVSRSGPPSEEVTSLENFAALQAHLPEFLMDNLTSPQKMGYTKPTPIQRHCIPLSMNGTWDVMACAQTGSGKTVAFLVPMIVHIANLPFFNPVIDEFEQFGYLARERSERAVRTKTRSEAPNIIASSSLRSSLVAQCVNRSYS